MESLHKSLLKSEKIAVTKYINLDLNTEFLTKTTETFTITLTEELNQSVTLLHIPNMADHIFVFHNGMYKNMGTDEDYIISGTTINFNTTYGNQLIGGDKVIIKYSY